MTKVKDRNSAVTLGLDIGTRLIKAVELAHTAGANRLAKFDFVIIDPPSSETKTKEAIKTLIKNFNPNAKSVNISFSAPASLVRFINMPKINETDLKNSLRFEADKYIPFNINEVIIDAVIVEDELPGNRETRVVLAAVKKDIVNSRLAMLKDLGLSVSVVDVDCFACFNAFRNSFKDEPPAKSRVILNIGFTQSNVVIALDKKPFFTRDIQIGGKDIIKSIAKALNLEEDGSESLIYSAGERQKEIFEAAKPALNSLAEEMRLSCGYYENQFGHDISEIYISGGIARLKGVLNHFEDNFGIKTTIWNPFQGFEIEEGVDKKLLEETGSLFAVACGLAVRQ